MIHVFVDALLVGFGLTAGALLALMLLALAQAIGGAIRDAKRRRTKRCASKSADHCGFERDLRSY